MSHVACVESGMIRQSTMLSERVALVIGEWQHRLLLDNWTILCEYTETQHLATCEAEPEYLSAILRFNVERIEKEIHNDLLLEELVLHELVHAVMWPLANMWRGLDENGQRVVEYFEEQAVTVVTKALLRTKYNNAAG